MLCYVILHCYITWHISNYDKFQYHVRSEQSSSDAANLYAKVYNYLLLIVAID